MDCGARERDYRARVFIRLAQDAQPFENVFPALDAGGLPNAFDPPSATAVMFGQGRRPVGSTIHEAATALTSAAARVSPLGAQSVVLGPSRPCTAVPESEKSACDFFPAPRSEDGILQFSMDPVSLAAFGVDNDFHGHSSNNAIFASAINGRYAAQTDALQRGQKQLPLGRVRKLANHHTALPQPYLMPQVISRSARRIARHAATSAAPASTVDVLCRITRFC